MELQEDFDFGNILFGSSTQDYAQHLATSLIPDVITGHWRLVSNFQKNTAKSLPNWHNDERNISRYLYDRNSLARAIVEANLNFVVGNGFKLSSDKDAANDWLNDLDDKYDLSQVEREILTRMIVDGEVWLKVVRVGLEPTGFEFIEPEMIQTPAFKASDKTIKDGIQYKQVATNGDILPDMNKVVGYWINDVFVKAEEIRYFKTDQKRLGRGLPEFTPVRQLIWLEEQVTKNIGHLLHVRSKFALIRKHAANGGDVAIQVSEGPNTSQMPGDVRGSQNVSNYPEGTILDSSKFTDYEMPFSNLDGEGYDKLTHLILEKICARFQLNVWMLSKETKMAAYSASMVSESQAVKMFQRRQNQIQRLLKWLLEAMALDAKVDLGTLTITPPRVQARNIDEDIKKCEFLIQHGLISEETVAGMFDIDLDEELDRTIIHKVDESIRNNPNESQSRPGKSDPQGGQDTRTPVQE